VPTISEFFGISIRIFYRDHDAPHFHAYYGSDEASVRIRDLVVVAGSLPPRALGLVIEWATIHRAELEHDWACARAGRPLDPIPPLR